MKVALYSFTNPEKKSLTLDLDKEYFDIPFNRDLMYQVVRAQRLNLRTSNAHTKTRGEVRGGGKKPWAQKYLGRARHGSIRSPIWVGGGVVFGPRNEKSYFRKINRKAKNKALFMALSAKIKDKEIFFVDEIMSDKNPKTKTFNSAFNNFIKKVLGEKINPQSSFLIVTPTKDPDLKRATANLPNIAVSSTESLSALLILSKKYVIILKDSIPYLLKRKFKTSK